MYCRVHKLGRCRHLTIIFTDRARHNKGRKYSSEPLPCLHSFIHLMLPPPPFWFPCCLLLFYSFVSPFLLLFPYFPHTLSPFYTSLLSSLPLYQFSLALFRLDGVMYPPACCPFTSDLNCCPTDKLSVISIGKPLFVIWLVMRVGEQVRLQRGYSVHILLEHTGDT